MSWPQLVLRGAEPTAPTSSTRHCCNVPMAITGHSRSQPCLWLGGVTTRTPNLSDEGSNSPLAGLMCSDDAKQTEPCIASQHRSLPAFSSWDGKFGPWGRKGPLKWEEYKVGASRVQIMFVQWRKPQYGLAAPANLCWGDPSAGPIPIMGDKH